MNILIYTVLMGALVFIVFIKDELESKAVKSAYNQCVIDSYSPTGENFLSSNKVNELDESAYRNWMLVCMQAKGHEFQQPFNSDGSTNNTCWEKDGIEAIVSSKQCFKEENFIVRNLNKLISTAN